MNVQEKIVQVQDYFYSLTRDGIVSIDVSEDERMTIQWIDNFPLMSNFPVNMMHYEHSTVKESLLKMLKLKEMNINGIEFTPLPGLYPYVARQFAVLLNGEYRDIDTLPTLDKLDKVHWVTNYEYRAISRQLAYELGLLGARVIDSGIDNGIEIHYLNYQFGKIYSAVNPLVDKARFSCQNLQIWQSKKYQERYPKLKLKVKEHINAMHFDVVVIDASEYRGGAMADADQECFEFPVACEGIFHKLDHLLTRCGV